MPSRCSRTSCAAAHASCRSSRSTSWACWALDCSSTGIGMGDVGDQLAHLPLDLRHRRHQPRGARRLGEPEVEEHVGAAVDREVAHLVHRLHVLAQRRQLGRAHAALGREHHGADLDGHAVVEHLAPVAAPELDLARAGQRRSGRDERPAAAPAMREQMAALGQRREGLAERRAGDAELVGELALRRQARARREQPQPDRRAQALDRLLERRRRLDGLEDRRHRRRGRGLHRDGDGTPTT